MRIWIVTVDGNQDFASNKWNEANDRYQDLKAGFGDERVKMISKTI